jgi:LysR family hydrogen peroxide-inducible transcriptional activator
VTLRQLQYAVAVADCGGFRAAAALCHVAQPSLSAQVAQLEEALGVQLFERDRRRVLVTPAGAEIVARARQLLAGAEDLLEAARRFADPLSGMLRIGVIPTIAPYLLPHAVPALRRRFPHLLLSWREDKTELLVAALGRGELDGALLALEADLGKLEHEVIARDPFVLALPRGHRLAVRRGAVPPEALAGQRMLLLDEGHCFRTQALSYCTRAGVEEQTLRATSLPTLVQMVAGGLGITLLPRMSVDTEVQRAQLTVRELGRPVPARTIVLGWRPGSALAAALRQIAAAIRDVPDVWDIDPVRGAA